MKRATPLVATILTLVQAFSSVASAQPRRPRPRPSVPSPTQACGWSPRSGTTAVPTVPVELTIGTYGLPFAVSTERREPAFALCQGQCSLCLETGTYWLQLSPTPETLGGERRFAIDGPSRVGIEPRTSSRQDLGLAVGVIGSVLVGVGLALLTTGIVGLTEDNASDDDRSTSGTILMVGVLSFVPGAVMTPLGWYQFGSSAPKVYVDPLL